MGGWIRGLTVVLAIGLLGTLGCAPERDEPDSSGPVRYWLADRDGAALFGLDADLYVRARVPAASPVGLSLVDGVVWVEERPRGALAAPCWRPLLPMPFDPPTWRLGMAQAEPPPGVDVRPAPSGTADGPWAAALGSAHPRAWLPWRAVALGAGRHLLVWPGAVMLAECGAEGRSRFGPSQGGFDGVVDALELNAEAGREGRLGDAQGEAGDLSNDLAGGASGLRAATGTGSRR